jgi:hypothetical protein
VIGINTAGDAYVLYSLDGQTSTTRPFAACHGSEAVRPVHLVVDARSSDALFLMSEPQVYGFENTGEQLWHYDFALDRLTRKAAIGLGRDSKGRRVIIDNPFPELRKMRICGEGLWNRLVVRYEAVVDTAFGGFSPSGRWVVLKSTSQMPNSTDVGANLDVCFSVFDTERDRVYPVVTLSSEGLWPGGGMVYWRD